jgi:hypothetical protein
MGRAIQEWERAWLTTQSKGEGYSVFLFSQKLDRVLIRFDGYSNRRAVQIIEVSDKKSHIWKKEEI